MNDYATLRGRHMSDGETAPLFRREQAHPCCRACGRDLNLSAPRKVACSCGWRVPVVLQTLLDS